MASVFTKIINGEIPCYKIYEDEHTFAFLDINPMHLGHTLVVPKTEIDNFIDLPEPYRSSLAASSQTIAGAIQTATGCARVGSMILGFDVPHVHQHLIPLNAMKDVDFSLCTKRSEAAMETICKRIQDALQSS